MTVALELPRPQHCTHKLCSSHLTYFLHSLSMLALTPHGILYPINMLTSNIEYKTTTFYTNRIYVSIKQNNRLFYSTNYAVPVQQTPHLNVAIYWLTFEFEKTHIVPS